MASPAVFRHEAMATWFELRTWEEDVDYARKASLEAFALLNRLESLLSRFREDSEISAIRRLQPGETCTVQAEVMDCLVLAAEMEELTQGAFTPCLGPLGAEGLLEGSLVLDPAQRCVGVEGGVVSLDLGAIGKGWALDKMAEFLAEWGLGASLLVAGGSSLLAFGDPVEPWELRLSSTHLLRLFQGSVGCSGLTVKGQHILDPRTRLPAKGPARAWALSGSAAVSDALSTSFMVLERQGVTELLEKRPECGGFIQSTEEKPALERLGRALGVRHQLLVRDSAP